MDIAQLITFFLIGIGLSFDSFAVSVSCGLMRKEIQFKQALPIAASLAFFQALFPALGWFAGKALHSMIRSVDHWIAFLLLTLIGIKMISEGLDSKSSPRKLDPFKKRVILGLSIATSIDALVVGFGLGFLEMPLLILIVIIGAVTFLASMLGMLFGKYIPSRRSRQSLIWGGIILIVIGLKILIEHLFY